MLQMNVYTVQVNFQAESFEYMFIVVVCIAQIYFGPGSFDLYVYGCRIDQSINTGLPTTDNQLSSASVSFYTLLMH